MKHIFRLLVLVYLYSPFAFSQQSAIPVVRTKQKAIKLYVDGEKDNINLNGKLPKEFAHSLEVDGGGSSLAIVSELDSLHFFLKPMQHAKFLLIDVHNDTMLCDFKGKEKRASFTKEYMAAHRNKTFIEIPQVYELINVIFALTPTGQTDPNIIYKDSDYYQKVLKKFSTYSNHPSVGVMDSLLRLQMYTSLKMNSYAYVFNKAKIVNGGVYHRLAGEEENSLQPYLPLLEDFASVSGFGEFYRNHQSYYQTLINNYKEDIDLMKMKTWLEKNFPATGYSTYKVIFSPLVAWNQSAFFYKDKEFSEAHAHINVPFRSKITAVNSGNLESGHLLRISFTEFNHAYINPEADNYGREINQAFGNLSKWTAGKASNYYQNSYDCFAEYLNWALLSLYYHDNFNAAEAQELQKGVEDTMVTFRGFSKFKEFNQELLKLYKHRKPGTTVAGLYPALLAWAASQ